jgi:hypothetical protein
MKPGAPSGGARIWALCSRPFMCCPISMWRRTLPCR